MLTIYLAGNEEGFAVYRKGDAERLALTVLMSFYKFQIGSVKEDILDMTDKGVSIFLDSGAFSAMTRGIEIGMDDYIDFIHEHKARLTVYANLDVIGDPKATYENQQIMEDAGLDPLPVFHFGEEVKWLDLYLDAGHDYIALGGKKKATSEQHMVWLDSLFSEYLTDEEGFPIVKVHGFGLTDVLSMIRYPWESVDSTSWLLGSRMGNVFVPMRRGGGWNFLLPPMVLSVSGRSSTIVSGGRHLDTLPPADQDVVLRWFEENSIPLGESEYDWVPESHEPADGEKVVKTAGVRRGKVLIETTVEQGVINWYRYRDLLNIHYFRRLEDTLSGMGRRRFKPTQMGGGFGL